MESIKNVFGTAAKFVKPALVTVGLALVLSIAFAPAVWGVTQGAAANTAMTTVQTMGAKGWAATKSFFAGLGAPKI